jgi:DNA-binding LacI/PurR family transcriptional regulator
MGRQRTTSADVARVAGVSRTTVSFVLNERMHSGISGATRQRVWATARELGYTPHAPARQLAAGTTMTLGLVFRQYPEQLAADALLAETLRGMTTAAQGAGYRVLVEAVPPNASYLDLLHARRVDGLVISGPRAEDAAGEGLGSEDLPIVVQGSLPGTSLPSVDVDNVAGARQAVELLLALGHRRIACITNAPLAYTAARERLDGYRAAIIAAGLTEDPDLIAEGEFDAASGHRAMEVLAARGVRFSAVYAANDMVAIGVIAALRAAGRRVPQDVSVVGFDDIPLAAYYDPPLTTTRLPARELGSTAGHVLIERVAGRPVAPRTLLPTELVIRSSAAQPPGATREEVS